MSDRRRRRSRRPDRDPRPAREEFSPDDACASRDDRPSRAGREDRDRDPWERRDGGDGVNFEEQDDAPATPAETEPDAAAVEADALAEFERRRDALLAARRAERESRAAVGPPDPNPSPSANPGPETPAGAGRRAAGKSADSQVVPAFSPFTPRRAVRRDGPMAWLGRHYRRFRRGLREDLTAYGHRYNSAGAAAGDPKPLLLWLVDLPRLFAMYFDHAEYRFTRGVTLLFRDLRSRPTRVEWDKASVFSPLVGGAPPTSADLNPIWTWPAVAAWLAAFREDWRTALIETFGGLIAIYENAKRELMAEFGAFFGRFGHVLAWAQANLTRFDRLFRGSDDSAWVFACGTGLAGLAMTSLLFLNATETTALAESGGVPNAALLAPAAADWGEDPRADDAALGPASDDFGEDLTDWDAVAAGEGWGDDPNEPDFDEYDTLPAPEPGENNPRDEWPVARAASPEPEPADDLGDPFGGEAFVYEPEPLPALEIAFGRRELPPEIPAYVPPSDDRRAVFEAEDAGRTALPDDPGGWAQAAPRRDRRRSRAAAPLRGTGPASGVSLEPLAASDADDGRSPVAAGLGLRVVRTPAAADGPDGALTYELRVTNDGDAPATAAVEERIYAGGTVVDAEPAAAFTADPGGGTLRWDLSGVRPGETRRLRVSVAPAEHAAEIDAEARVVAAVAVASATSVEAAPDREPFRPAPDDPPPFEPAPYEPTPFQSTPFDPMDGDAPADDPPAYDDFGDDDFGGLTGFGDEPATPEYDEELDDPPLPNPFGDDEPEPFPASPVADPPPPRPLPDDAVRPAQILTPRDPEPPAPRRSAADAPRLRVTLAGPPSASRGSDVRLIVTVTNDGAGPAEAVTISCAVPAGLTHPRGRTVRCVLGTVAPGETRTATLIARVNGAAGPSLTPTAEVTARGGHAAEVRSPLRVRDGRGAGLIKAACR